MEKGEGKRGHAAKKSECMGGREMRMTDAGKCDKGVSYFSCS